MWTSWSHLSARGHAQFVIALLVAGILTSLVLGGAGQVQSAWLVVVVFASGACGALFRLSQRLPEADLPDARSAG